MRVVFTIHHLPFTISCYQRGELSRAAATAAITTAATTATAAIAAKAATTAAAAATTPRSSRGLRFVDGQVATDRGRCH